MPDEFAYDVFLSCSPRDKVAVRPLAERLRADGLRVWYFEWELKPGGNTVKKVEEGLASSRALVLCMSANAFGASRPALEKQTLRFRDPQDAERRFIPLRLDDAPVPAALAQFVAIEWGEEGRDEEQREREYARLSKICALPEPLVAKAKSADKLVVKKAIQHNNEKDVLAYSFSLDGKRIFTGDEDNTVRLWDLESGHCLRVLEGHTSEIWSVAWSADQRYVLSGSYDKTVRIWEVESGRCLRVLEGHTSEIWSVAWSADQRYVLSGSKDKTIRLWEVESGRCLRVLEGHTGLVRNVIFSTDQRRALSASNDMTVRLWEIEDGRCLQVFKGHTDKVYCIAWSADQRYALSGSKDTTIRLWDMESGRCLRVFEGHNSYIWRVAWSADHDRFLSGAGSDDNSVRLWDVESGRCLHVFEGHSGSVFGIAWSPDGRHAFSGDRKGGIRIWDLSEFVGVVSTTKAVTREQTQYTNAKVLLVGDTGVGKSGLAERLVHRQFVPTKSSHARKAHVLESKTVEQPGGVALHQETLLWDLAGQPAYRLVHQLSMEDAALACVLFDCRNETNPFEGAAYWSQALDQASANTRVRKLLVASRIDVGGLPAGRERIEAFAREHGFAGFIPTSAYTGEGCDELAAAIRAGIAWDELPKVTTTDTLAALRDYMARLKGEKEATEASPVKLFTVAALHEGFAAHFGKKLPFSEFVAHLQRLEATDAIDLLVFHTTGAAPEPATLVLLDPTRVDAYASALLVAAKDEPDGPGHLLETRVREGDFRLDKDERIPDRAAERHVLWFVLENLLSRDLALRERIGGQDYIVFPSQCTTELTFPGVAAFGVAYGFAGPVRGIYATLIAQLAHYAGFKKREFFQDAAAYWAEAGGRCLVRLRDRGRGQGELDVSFDGNTPPAVRQGFLEFVGKHLEARANPGSVTRRHAYHCANAGCQNPFEDRVVKIRLETGKKDLLCPLCEQKTPLVNLLAAPNAAAESVAIKIGTDARAGRQRMTAGLVIRAKEAEGKFDVFLSHNARDKPAVEKIAQRLLAVGIRPWLDKWNLAPGDTVTDALEHAIKTIPCAALCFGPADIGRWHILEIRAYLERWAGGTARMVPVILPGAKDPPELPIFIRQTLWVDLRNWESDASDGFYRLVCGILARAPGAAPIKKFGARDVADWQELHF